MLAKYAMLGGVAALLTVLGQLGLALFPEYYLPFCGR